MRPLVALLMVPACAGLETDPEPIEVDPCRIPRKVCQGPMTITTGHVAPPDCPQGTRIRRPQDLIGCTDIQGTSGELQETEWLDPHQGGSLCLVGDEALAAAASVRHVRRGHLHIVGTSAADLSALTCMRDAATVWIRSNPELESTAGMSSLRRTQAFFLADLPRLERMEGFDALEEVELIWLDDLPELTTLRPFPSFEGAMWEVMLRDLPALEGVADLDLWSEGRIVNYYLGQIGQGTDLRALQLPEGTARFFQIENALYESLDGLALTRLERLGIFSNPRLREVSAIQHLEGEGSMAFRRNESLPEVIGPDLVVGGEEAQYLFQENASLTRVGGFAGVQEASALVFGDSPRLEQVDAFSGLQRAELVVLEDLPALERWGGLASIQEIERLELVDLPALTTLDGCLPELRRVRELTVRDVPSLDPCSVQRLLDQLEKRPRIVAMPDLSSCER